MTLTQQLHHIDTALADLRPLIDQSDWSVATDVQHRADGIVVNLERLRCKVATLLAQENPLLAKTA